MIGTLIVNSLYLDCLCLAVVGCLCLALILCGGGVFGGPCAMVVGLGTIVGCNHPPPRRGVVDVLTHTVIRDSTSVRRMVGVRLTVRSPTGPRNGPGPRQFN